MEKFSVRSWWSSWRGQTPRRQPRELEPADMGTAFGMEATAQADAMFGLPAPWHNGEGNTKPADDRATL